MKASPKAAPRAMKATPKAAPKAMKATTACCLPSRQKMNATLKAAPKAMKAMKATPKAAPKAMKAMKATLKATRYLATRNQDTRYLVSGTWYQVNNRHCNILETCECSTADKEEMLREKDFYPWKQIHKETTDVWCHWCLKKLDLKKLSLHTLSMVPMNAATVRFMAPKSTMKAMKAMKLFYSS